MSDDNGQSGGLPSELELLKTRARLIGVEFSNNIGVDTLRERVAAKMAEMDDDGDSEPAGPPSAPSDDKIPDVIDTADSEDAGEGDEPVEDFDAGIEEDEEEAAPPVPVTPVNGFDAAAQLAATKATAPPTSGPIKPFVPPVKPVADLSAGTKTGQPVAPKEGRRLSLRQHMFNEQMRLVRLRIQNLDPKKSDLNGEILTIANKHLGTIKCFVPYGEVTDDGWHIPFIIYKELERRRFLSIRTVKNKATGQPEVKKGWAKEFALDVLPPLSEAEIKQLGTAQQAAGSIDSGNGDIL